MATTPIPARNPLSFQGLRWSQAGSSLRLGCQRDIWIAPTIVDGGGQCMAQRLARDLAAHFSMNGSVLIGPITSGRHGPVRRDRSIEIATTRQGEQKLSIGDMCQQTDIAIAVIVQLAHVGIIE